MRSSLSLLALSLCLTVTPVMAQAQAPAPAHAATQSLTAEARDQALAIIKAALTENYVFPEKTAAIISALDAANHAGRYTVDDPQTFAGRVTADMLAASQDHHLYLTYDPRRFQAAMSAPDGDQGIEGFDAARARLDNYGLTDQRILAGNIRYLKISGFEWVKDETGAAYDGAMRFLKGGGAIIIDLRGNGGGDAAAVRYLVSHFMAPDTLELTFWAGRTASQSRTLDYLPAGRLDGKPLYVLIDSHVASAGESFAYDVQQFKLGKLVGRTTLGAANNNKFIPVAPGFLLSVSFGRPVHPVSGGNWEGAGVAPDVAVNPRQALATAELLAIDALAAKPGVTADARRTLAWARTGAAAELNPVTLPQTTLAAMAGTYDDVVLTYRDGALWLSRPSQPIWPQDARLTPLTADGLFAVEGMDMLRVQPTDKGLELWWSNEETPRLKARK